MSEIEPQEVWDGRTLGELLVAGMRWLECNQGHVDALNVFPVPDGDTGKNMHATMRNAIQGLEGAGGEAAGDISAALAQGALMGARGNSGVILSQLWQGLSESLRGQETLDARNWTAAWRAAVEAAYRALSEPVEGTILTVARETAEALESAQAAGEADLARLLEFMTRAAEDSLQRTPALLPVLAQAGVVDSGGQGLLYILEGMCRRARGEELPSAEVAETTPVHAHAPAGAGSEEDEDYGYDVQFLMRGANMDVPAIRAGIEAIGWSTLVVGEPELIKVHVHVHDPGEPISWAIAQGVALDDVVVENMQLQAEQLRLAQAPAAESVAAREAGTVAVIAVACGDGMKRMLREYGAARVIDGGQTMNPSPQDFLDAMAELPQENVVLLPNNSNILLAAQQAAALAAEHSVGVVPSKSLPQGIAALLACPFQSEQLDEILAAMSDALGRVISGELTKATRDAEFDGLRVREGQYIGLVDGRLVLAEDCLASALRALVTATLDGDSELVTLYYGVEPGESRARELAAELGQAFPDLELELLRGDQPLYPFLLGVE